MSAQVIAFPRWVSATPHALDAMMQCSIASRWLHIVLEAAILVREQTKANKPAISDLMLDRLLETEGFASNCTPTIRAALLSIRDELIGQLRRETYAAHIALAMGAPLKSAEA